MRLPLLSLLTLLVWLPVAARPARADDQVITVKSGDTLGALAQKHGVTAKALADANRLKDADALQVGQRLRLPGAAPAKSGGAAATYTVKAGDTLSEIAAARGVGVDALARANSLRSDSTLQIGQILRIPSGETAKPAAGAAAAAPPRHRLPVDLQQQLDRIRVSKGRWKYVVIHHSATTTGTAKGMEQYHRRRGMENGLAYHFVIGNGRGMADGRIEIGSRWKKQIKGGHLASERQNEYCIGICLVGNFETSRPTSRQLGSLYALVQYLKTRTGGLSVRTHRQINVRPTQCPGRYFPTSDVLRNT